MVFFSFQIKCKSEHIKLIELLSLLFHAAIKLLYIPNYRDASLAPSLFIYLFLLGAFSTVTRFPTNLIRCIISVVHTWWARWCHTTYFKHLLRVLFMIRWSTISITTISRTVYNQRTLALYCFAFCNNVVYIFALL